MARNNKSSSSASYIIFLLILLAVTAYAVKNYMPSKNEAIADSNHSALSRSEVEKIVKEVIRSNPELIMSSVEDYQATKYKEMEEKSKVNLQQKKSEIEDVSSSPYAGNLKGDITIIEFFDYACGYCKKANKVINKLLEEDHNIKVIFKELPILGENSLKISKTALAVFYADKDKYKPFHDAMMTISGIDESVISKTVASLNLDMAKYKSAFENPKIAEDIEKVRKLAADIGVHGTPAFIIDGDLVSGALDIDNLKKKIAEKRKK